MARVFAYLMKPDVEMSDSAIFEDVSTIIRDALLEVYKQTHNTTGIAEAALAIALKKLVK
jgi:hypothetical protein